MKERINQAIVYHLGQLKARAEEEDDEGFRVSLIRACGDKKEADSKLQKILARAREMTDWKALDEETLREIHGNLKWVKGHIDRARGPVKDEYEFEYLLAGRRLLCQALLRAGAHFKTASIAGSSCTDSALQEFPNCLQCDLCVRVCARACSRDGVVCGCSCVRACLREHARHSRCARAWSRGGV